ncbi:MAG: DNA-directed RNA polymerase subunit G [Sulfolobales archaeon]|nr:DNA-directed RNA polymerase subunit G [Sulfolobales archaeon]MCG2907709.1 DNA-directed RNA polymerase subunit G [Sulfolobales archaeon]
MPKIEKQCKVISKVPGSLKGLKLLNLDCGDFTATVDLVQEIDVFDEGNDVAFVVSRDKPNYTPNDFCAHGYLFYEKKSDNAFVSLISLYGLLVKIVSNSGIISSGILNMMDHVYVCIKKLN